MTKEQREMLFTLLQAWADTQQAKKPTSDEIAAWFYGKDE